MEIGRSGLIEGTKVKPTLKTGRTILHLPEPEEAEYVLTYFRKNREHLANAGPAWPPDFLTVAHWQKQLETNLQEFQDDQSLRLFLFDRSNPETVLGAANLSNTVRNAAHFCHLGYHIDRDFQGKGIMKEALQSVITYGFTAMNLHRIMANYQPENSRSGGLLRSLGFNVEGYARDYLFIDGKWRDHVLTSIINPNWSNRS
ncbi:MAG: GNAT family N-acetyltransferase [Cyanobacteria bacterium SZAS LIN-3]|nr:GNAT family N-acetyltransferase [Cyanobacteria bacterium SZAS LIN-3]